MTTRKSADLLDTRAAIAREVHEDEQREDRRCKALYRAARSEPRNFFGPKDVPKRRRPDEQDQT